MLTFSVYAAVSLLPPVCDLAPVPPLPPGAVRRIGEDRFRRDHDIADFALSADGKTVFTTSWDAVYAWNLDTGRLLWHTRKLNDGWGGEFKLAVAGDLVIRWRDISGDFPNTGGPSVALDRATGHEVGRWPSGPVPPELWAKVNPGDRRRYLVHRTRDDAKWTHTATFRDRGGVARPFTASGRDIAESRFAISPDGRTVALKLFWSNPQVYDVQTGGYRGGLKVEDGEAVTPLAFTPDGRELIVHCEKGRENWVDVRPITGAKARRLAEQSDPDRAIRYAARVSPDGTRVALHEGNAWEVRELTTGRLLFTTPGWRGGDRGPLGEFTPDGQRFVTEWGKRFDVSDVRTGEAAGPPVLPGDLQLLRWTADGRLVGLGDRAVATWDAATGRRTSWSQLPPDRDRVYPIPAVDLSADGTRMAYLTHSHTGAAVVDLRTGSVRRLDFAQHRVASAIGLTPDGSRVVLGNRTGTNVYDAATGKVLRPLPGELDWRDPLVFTPDGLTVTAISPERTTTGNLGTGRVTVTEGERIALCGQAALPDNRHVVMAVAIWEATKYGMGRPRNWLLMRDVTTGREVARADLSAAWPSRRYPYPDGSDFTQQFHPRAVAALPDGKRVAVADSGGRVHLFDVFTRKMLRTFDCAPRNPRSAPAGPVAVSPDGKQLAVACEGSILIWDIDGK